MLAGPLVLVLLGSVPAQGAPAALVHAAVLGNPTNAEMGDEAPTCIDAPQPAPAVIDCNDGWRADWLRDMIGLCDMPRATGFGAASASLARGRSAAPTCGSFECASPSSPMRAAVRPSDDAPPALPRDTRLAHQLRAFPLVEWGAPLPASGYRPRLERPPRAG